MELTAGKSVINQEIKALNLLKKGLDKPFKDAINILFSVSGKIIISGIGKSGHVGSKISSTLSSASFLAASLSLLFIFSDSLIILAI